MESNANTKGAFWMLVEDLRTDSVNENTDTAAVEKQEILDDEFFPDTSF